MDIYWDIHSPMNELVYETTMIAFTEDIWLYFTTLNQYESKTSSIESFNQFVSIQCDFPTFALAFV